MALTQLQIQLCSQEGQRATQACVEKYRKQVSANRDRIQKAAKAARDANWDAYIACQKQVPGGVCPPTSTEDTEENRNICASCWEAYSKEQAKLLSEEFDALAAEDRFLDEKTNQRYDPLGNPLPGCECCDEGRTAEAACRRRGATPIAIPVKPTVPQPYRLEIKEEGPLDLRTRLLFGPIPA